MRPLAMTASSRADSQGQDDRVQDNDDIRDQDNLQDNDDVCVDLDPTNLGLDTDCAGVDDASGDNLSDIDAMTDAGPEVWSTRLGRDVGNVRRGIAGHIRNLLEAYAAVRNTDSRVPASSLPDLPTSTLDDVNGPEAEEGPSNGDVDGPQAHEGSSRDPLDSDGEPEAGEAAAGPHLEVIEGGGERRRQVNPTVASVARAIMGMRGLRESNAAVRDRLHDMYNMLPEDQRNALIDQGFAEFERVMLVTGLVEIVHRMRRDDHPAHEIRSMLHNLLLEQGISEDEHRAYINEILENADEEDATQAASEREEAELEQNINDMVNFIRGQRAIGQDDVATLHALDRLYGAMEADQRRGLIREAFNRADHPENNEPTEPGEPTEPTEPTEPSEPAEPGEPGGPTGPELPNDVAPEQAEGFLSRAWKKMKLPLGVAALGTAYGTYAAARYAGRLLWGETKALVGGLVDSSLALLKTIPNMGKTLLNTFKDNTVTAWEYGRDFPDKPEESKNWVWNKMKRGWWRTKQAGAITFSVLGLTGVKAPVEATGKLIINDIFGYSPERAKQREEKKREKLNLHTVVDDVRPYLQEEAINKIENAENLDAGLQIARRELRRRGKNYRRILARYDFGHDSALFHNLDGGLLGTTGHLLRTLDRAVLEEPVEAGRFGLLNYAFGPKEYDEESGKKRGIFEKVAKNIKENALDWDSLIDQVKEVNWSEAYEMASRAHPESSDLMKSLYAIIKYLPDRDYSKIISNFLGAVDLEGLEGVLILRALGFMRNLMKDQHVIERLSARYRAGAEGRAARRRAQQEAAQTDESATSTDNETEEAPAPTEDAEGASNEGGDGGGNTPAA